MNSGSTFTLFILAMSSLYMCRRCCGVEIINRTVLVGNQLFLFCPLNNSTNDVIWKTASPGRSEISISTCMRNTMSCTDIDPAASGLATYKASRNETTSTLTINVTERILSIHNCIMDGVIVQSYYFLLINSEDILSPTCSISPSLFSGGFDVSRINHSCQSHLSQEISQRLNISSVNETLVTGDSTSLNYIVDSDDKRIQVPVLCKMLLTDVNEARNCIFPKKATIHSQANSIDMEFECNSSEREENDQIFWRLMEPDGNVTISNRSWIRQKGRLMLLRDITEQDDGRVVKCVVHHHNNSSIGFYKIELDSVNFPSVSSGEKETDGTGEDITYKTLFAVFFILWVLTVAVIVAWFMYPKAKSHWHPSTFTSRFRYSGNHRSEGEGREVGHDMPEKKTSNTSVNEGNHNNSSSNNISTRGNDMSITSYTAPTKDTLQSEASAVDNPLYFCVDRSPPTTIRSSWRSCDEHGAGDNDPEGALCDELDPSGYDYVGTPQTGNRERKHQEVDNDVYAEVGKNQCLYGKVKK